MPLLYAQLLALQNKVAELIEGSEYLSGYSVATEAKGDLSKQIAQSLNKLGLCMVVLTPATKVVDRFVDRVIRDVTIEVGCYENPILNKKDGVRKTALAAACAVTEAVNYASNGQIADEFDEDIAGHFEMLEDDLYLVPDTKTGILTYRVAFHTHISTENT